MELKEYFHSDKCYQKYLYAKSLAEQVNHYIDNGFLVYDEDMNIMNKFVFVSNIGSTPVIAEKISKNCIAEWICSTYDENGKIWYYNKTKKNIKERFSQIKICNPKDIKILKFKK